MMTNKEKELKEILIRNRLCKESYNVGFQEGKTQTLEKVKEKIERFKTRLFGFVFDSLMKDINKIEKEVNKEIDKLLSSLEDLDVPEEKE